jgi:hypothetical protein
MRTTVQARLDAETRKTLRELQLRLGWTPSKIVREGVRLLASCHRNRGHERIAGLGKFSSGIADLGSNKSHLKDFGR